VLLVVGMVPAVLDVTVPGSGSPPTPRAKRTPRPKSYFCNDLRADGWKIGGVIMTLMFHRSTSKINDV
jgi:hypothetical protein